MLVPWTGVGVGRALIPRRTLSVRQTSAEGGRWSEGRRQRDYSWLLFGAAAAGTAAFLASEVLPANRERLMTLPARIAMFRPGLLIRARLAKLLKGLMLEVLADEQLRDQAAGVSCEVINQLLADPALLAAAHEWVGERSKELAGDPIVVRSMAEVLEQAIEDDGVTVAIQQKVESTLKDKQALEATVELLRSAAKQVVKSTLPELAIDPEIVQAAHVLAKKTLMPWYLRWVH